MSRFGGRQAREHTGDGNDQYRERRFCPDGRRQSLRFSPERTIVRRSQPGDYQDQRDFQREYAAVIEYPGFVPNS